MSILNFVFDPLNFVSGAMIASAAFGVNGFLSKKRHAKTIDTFEDAIFDARREFTRFQEKENELQEQSDLLENKFATSFPAADFKTCIIDSNFSNFQKNVKELLESLNKADTFNKRTTLNERKELRATIDKQIKALDYAVPYVWMSFKNSNSLIDFNVTLRAKAKKAVESNNQALVRLTDQWEKEILPVYSPEFVAELPPALFHAESSLHKFREYNGVIQTNFYMNIRNSSDDKIYNIDYVFSNLESEFAKVTNYSSVAMDKSSRCRTVLKRFDLRNNPTSVGYKKALASLVAAELYDYKEGNPNETFVELTQPFREFATKHQLIGSRDRIY